MIWCDIDGTGPVNPRESRALKFDHRWDSFADYVKPLHRIRNRATSRCGCRRNRCSPHPRLTGDPQTPRFSNFSGLRDRMHSFGNRSCHFRKVTLLQPELTNLPGATLEIGLHLAGYKESRNRVVVAAAIPKRDSTLPVRRYPARRQACASTFQIPLRRMHRPVHDVRSPRLIADAC